MTVMGCGPGRGSKSESTPVSTTAERETGRTRGTRPVRRAAPRGAASSLRVLGATGPRGAGQEEGALTAGDAGFTLTGEGVSTAAQPAGIMRPNVH